MLYVLVWESLIVKIQNLFQMWIIKILSYKFTLNSELKMARDIIDCHASDISETDITSNVFLFEIVDMKYMVIFFTLHFFFGEVYYIQSMKPPLAFGCVYLPRFKWKFPDNTLLNNLVLNILKYQPPKHFMFNVKEFYLDQAEYWNFNMATWNWKWLDDLASRINIRFCTMRYKI